MKRFLLGVTLLSSVVGTGAVGAFYGHDFLSQAAPPKTETESAPKAAARDLTPSPIPLAEVEPNQLPAAANPFAGQRVQVATTAAADAYNDQALYDRNDPPTEALPPGERAATNDPEDQLGVEVSEGDIPAARELDDADASAARAIQPLPAAESRYGDYDDRFAERTAAAEELQPALDPSTAADEDLAGDEPAEPRELDSVPQRGSFDRYGSPLPKVETPQAVAAPTADNFAPEDDLQTGRVGAHAGAGPDAQQPFSEQTPAALEPIPSGAAATVSEGTGRPGDPQLSGAQAPALTIEKTAPPEIQIGKPAKFVIKVRNTGAVTAHGVEIHDTIPQGTQLESATPQPELGTDGQLVWLLGALKPGNEQTIEIVLMPTEEGEVGSVATVQFRAEASVRSLVTRPMLELDITGPQRVMKGQPVGLRIKIANPGSGAATGIVLSESVPKELSHPAGSELEFDVGTLEPGQSRDLELALSAVEAGRFVNMITARGDGNLHTEAQVELEVVAPALAVSLDGPKRRYLERNATHNISVSNPGTAAAKDIELVAVLPRELQFVSANNNGQFDAATHSVYWSLAELPPQETGTVTLTTLPLQPGDAKLLIKSRAQQDLSDEREEVVAIDGLAAINFQLRDASDPIEVNGQTSYEVRVTNQGTKAASNVQLVALLPAEMKAVSADGPVRHHIEGQRVIFEPLKQLGAKADTTYRLTTQALQPGDLRLQVQIVTDEIREPITKEESTRVYGDE